MSNVVTVRCERLTCGIISVVSVLFVSLVSVTFYYLHYFSLPPHANRVHGAPVFVRPDGAYNMGNVFTHNLDDDRATGARRRLQERLSASDVQNCMRQHCDKVKPLLEGLVLQCHSNTTRTSCKITDFTEECCEDFSSNDCKVTFNVDEPFTTVTASTGTSVDESLSATCSTVSN